MVRKWLIDARDSKGYSQEEVADSIGITRQYYGMIESGVRNPRVPLAQNIGNFLNINWTLFFEEGCNKMLHKASKEVV